MKNFDNLREIDKKWQTRWRDDKLFRAYEDDERENMYVLFEFPYPSGIGLHVGHMRPYTAMDVVARCMRQKGKNVLFPMGWDAFGLPTENYSIKNKIHPKIVTREREKMFREQLDAAGYSLDWEREVDTTDPEYYKWTQRIFLKLHENGLAYKSKMPVNWCSNCKIIKANEEVIDGGCDICGGEVTRREKSQWLLKITAYAQKLLDGLDEVDFPERVKSSQRNWIGKSEGAEVRFGTTVGDVLTVFTTRPDTLFGATYMVIAPEHPLVENRRALLENAGEIDAYKTLAAKKSDFERAELAKDKTGVELKGVRAKNPVNGAEIPIFISDYVLAGYGTGAIMAVPGHDARDWEFAKKFNLPIIEVVSGGDVETAAFTDCDTGVMANSGFLTGLSVAEAKVKISDWLEENKLGERKVNFKLRDWVFSRQRYWGEPIPIVYCEKCGETRLPESALPLTLPEVESYEPTDDGESPLSSITDWVNTTCPKCGGHAVRETDTMPQWAGSSWYFLRYTDPGNKEAFASPERLKRWLPVDWYNGGMEHTTLHLLYSRFWHRFLYDIGEVPCPEPYKRRTSQGMLLGNDGQKMSKSRGNGVDPMEVIERYGADTLRLYVMFIGDFEKAAIWSDDAVRGCRRFVERIYTLSESAKPTDAISPATEKLLHKTIKKVSGDIEHLKFNTAIAQLMTLLNAFYDTGASRGDLDVFLRLLAPFAPHTADEVRERLGYKGYASASPYPEFDPAKTLDDEVTVAVQVNGKLRAAITVPADAEEEAVKAAGEAAAQYLAGKTIVKTVFVKNKIVNFVAR